MIISHSQKFVFLHVHKTAGESITVRLRQMLVQGDVVIHGKATVDANGTRLSKHSTARDVRDALQSETWDRYFTFGFVRHPIDRTVSLYRYMAERSRPPELTMAQRLGLRPVTDNGDRSHWPEVQAYRATSSISEFIRHPLLDESKSMKPQSTSLCDEEGNLLVDFVGRFERLDDDFAYVEQQLGLTHLPLKRINVSRQRHAECDELSFDDRAYLRARFEEDFRRFGYEP
jgi:hypothetical protein